MIIEISLCTAIFHIRYLNKNKVFHFEFCNDGLSLGAIFKNLELKYFYSDLQGYFAIKPKNILLRLKTHFFNKMMNLSYLERYFDDYIFSSS